MSAASRLVKDKLDLAGKQPFSSCYGAKKDRGTGFSVLAAQEIEREPKNERWGGEGRKETFSDYPQDFENPARQSTGSRIARLVEY